MSYSNEQWVRGFTFYDPANTGLNITGAVAVSLATAAEVTAAQAAGIQSVAGGLVVPTPISSGLPTRQIIGVVRGSQVNGRQVDVVVSGIVEVWANAAVVAGALVFPVAQETRTKSQTPFANDTAFEFQMPVAPDVPESYLLNLVDDTAIAPQSGSANVLYFPLGIALQAASAKYDLIPVLLQTGRIYA